MSTLHNDIPDWTAQAKSNLTGGLSGVNLGDVAAPALAIDQVTDSPSGNSGSGSGLLVSFKAAAGSTFALVGVAGAPTVGTKLAVTGAFGQVTGAGHLLTARVTAPAASSEPTTTAAGWVKQKSAQLAHGWVSSWALLNSLGTDAAPQFTCDGAGGALMACVLNEYSGGNTASQPDQSGTADLGAGGSLTVIAGGADAAFGDLVELVARWYFGDNGPNTFTTTYNNGGTAVDDGTANDSANLRRSHFSHAIIPAATIAQPLGVADWAYDATGTSAPAAGVQASVVLAATPGKTYTLAMLCASVINAAAAGANAPIVQVLDGATVIFSAYLASTATAGSGQTLYLTGLALKGTAGNSMTVRFNVAVANNFESVSCGAYLR